MVAEDRVQKTNAIETTTIELFATDSDTVNITGTVKDIEPSVIREPATVKKDNSTEETTVELKEKEEKDETITANANLEYGPNPLTSKADYSAAKEVVGTSSNGKISNKEQNARRMDQRPSIQNKESFKEPDPSNNHEQVKKLQSKAEKLINAEDSESHTNEKEANIHPIKKEQPNKSKAEYKMSDTWNKKTEDKVHQEPKRKKNMAKF